MAAVATFRAGYSHVWPLRVRSVRVRSVRVRSVRPTAVAASQPRPDSARAPDAHVSPCARLVCVQEAEGNWRLEVIKRLEKLKLLDGALIEDEEREAAKAEG
jgi:hypothetical protein